MWNIGNIEDLGQYFLFALSLDRYFPIGDWDSVSLFIFKSNIQTFLIENVGYSGIFPFPIVRDK